MTRLAELLPAYDIVERHERRVPASPDDAVAAALATLVAPDGLVRALFRLRGLPAALIRTRWLAAAERALR
jgi:hypothetical protein